MRWFVFAGLLPLAVLAASSVNPLVSNAASLVPETSDATFARDVLQSKKPVLVDFYATWCGPCKRMAPVIDELSAEYHDKMKVFRMDIDKNPGVAEQLGIESVPTFAVFKPGKEIVAAVGALPKQQLAERIDASLK